MNFPTPIKIQNFNHCVTVVLCKNEIDDNIYATYFRYGELVNNWLEIPSATAIEVSLWINKFCAENNYNLYSY